MVDKLFDNVFQNIPLTGSVKECFKDSIVTNFMFLKTQRQIVLDLKCKHYETKVITKSMLDLKNCLLKKFPGLSEVIINLKFDITNCNAEALTNILMNHVLMEFKDKRPFYYTLLSKAIWTYKGNLLVIETPMGAPIFLIETGLDKQICEIVFNSFDINLRVQFRESEKQKLTTKTRNQVSTPSSINTVIIKPEIEKNLNQIVQPKKITESSKSSLTSPLLGKKISGQITPISQATEEGETLILEGTAITVNFREIKGSKTLVTFDISDKTDSLSSKFFLKNDKLDDIKSGLKKGVRLRVKGELQFDRFSRENILLTKDIELLPPAKIRMDNSQDKRVELHLHTHMSQMDAVTSAEDYIKRAALWGHKAIAITDHGVVQAFPEAASSAKKNGIKILYGMEAYLVNDLGSVVQMSKSQPLTGTYTVFDVETTGLSRDRDSLTEIGAVKVVNGEIKERFQTFVNPGRFIPKNIVELTGITDEMVADAPSSSNAVKAFLDFAGDSVLVAHNAPFDIGFIRTQTFRDGYNIPNTLIDTLELSKALLPELSKHKLNTVCEHLDISLENHHRASDDAEATANMLLKFFDMLTDKGIDNIDHINALASEKINHKKTRYYHAIIFAKNQAGLRTLYELVSDSHIKNFYRRPRVLKSELARNRENLIIGSACEAGELFKALLSDSPEEVLTEIVNFYDYLEIQPLGNNQFLLDTGVLQDKESLIRINQRIVELGYKHGKLVAATCDSHFLEPEDEIYRRIIMKGDGFSDADRQPPLYFRTTDEMLLEFEYLGERAKEVVIDNTIKIADLIQDIKPIPDETFPPEIEGAEEELREGAIQKAIEIYGSPLPKPVEDRLFRELDSIIKNGFAVMYIIAKKLVLKSNSDGYLVGSRGSVGSSFAATMASITEVNPLPPHYVCPSCKFSDFDSEIVIKNAGCAGYDMPDRDCPVCGHKLNKDGHDIPFETFLGFDGDKEPDIDLNFSGDYQQKAHLYTEELFGKENVFKAGTIGTLAEKTAYGYVKKYYDEKEIIKSNAEINRLISGCTGIKRTTGQHPGGLMIVPKNQSVFNFTPIQRPANDMKSEVTTTHFDYHSISGRLLKLDILGHDDPTVIRMLFDLTGVDPKNVPLDDAKTLSLFTSTKALGVTNADIKCETGTLAIPEFGTKFVRQMLKDTQPTTFSELVRISGLSHGTDVWLNNAQEYVRQKVATLKDVISTRDDIMVYLIIKGVEKKRAFKIMENVRKGKGLADEDIAEMKSVGVPDWYIESCTKIKYMFPKAHAAAYVMMAFRIAYFKVHHPEAFYASYFSVRADDFDYESMCKGMSILESSINELEEKGNSATAKEKNKLTIAEVVREMYARGIKFLPLHLYDSHAEKFQLTPNGILPPLNSLQGLGITAANSISQAREKGEFISIEDLRVKTGISKTVIELLKQNNVLEGLPATSQLSLF